MITNLQRSIDPLIDEPWLALLGAGRFGAPCLGPVS